MNIGQPPTVGLREHYRQLRSSQPWLDVAMCWTVVVPDSGQALPLHQLAARLSGDAPYRLFEPAPPKAVLLPYDTDLPVSVDWCGAAAMLVEDDFLGSTPAVLRRLSEGARVYSAWWNVNAHNRLSFASSGELVLAIDAFGPGRPEDHPGIGQWPELRAMTDFFVDFEERGEDYDWQAAMLAVIDQTTGARLTSEWLEQPHPYVTVRMPDALR
ncbi:DUF6461 domain-containing protein [Nonomuraea sp. WAC 01424]|uniref:DUF6461 domain-containing protein n=1 Tax=Nonomuraea sp. WAC 01424 TaxID=2203200 RepID=UPI000F77C404|nr:DUF6461 domain-containing protein [Nonomuraea sp. WAC 01424]